MAILNYKPIAKEHEAFMKQRKAARERGIEFLFTYEQWKRWWGSKLGPGWFQKRGRVRGKYCMARKLDRGPYAWWNVDCKLFEENCRERKQNGSTPKGALHGMSKITDEIARAIYLSKDKPKKIAQQYGVSTDIVSRVQKRRCWIHATRGLPLRVVKQVRHLTHQEIRAIFCHPGSVGEVARKFGCPYGWARRIKKRLDWKHITNGLTPPPENLWGRLGGHALKGTKKA